MWYSWLGANVAAGLALMSPPSLGPFLFVVSGLLYFRTGSEMRRQLRLRNKMGSQIAWVVWWLAGVLMPVAWPLWRHANKIPHS